MRSEYTEIWELLNKRSRGSSNNDVCYQEANSCGKTSVSYALNLADGRYGILIRSPEIREDYSLPKSTRGFSSKLIFLSGYLYLGLWISDEKYNDVFRTFSEDLVRILGSLPDDSDALSVILNHILKWENFMEKLHDGGLSPEEQRGLFGELYFMEHILVPVYGIKDTIRCWYGSEKNPQDFLIGQGSAVEVKTTISKSPVLIHISSEHQLDADGFFALYLYHQELVRLKGTGDTLNGIVDRMRELAADDAETYTELNRKLTLRNYRFPDRSIYEDYGYSVAHEHIYHVSEDFPKITRNDLISGVCNVKYAITVGSLTSFEIEMTEFEEHLRRMEL